MEDPRPPLIAVLGPTAAGKTDLAVALASELDCELISVDSAQVYRGLDIGSAKPGYPHHLVDIRDPAEVYSVADFVADAGRIARQVTSRGRIPVLVGGTMLYFRAFMEGLAPMPTADPALRYELEQRAVREGWESLHRELLQVDPEAAARIHPRHSQRLVRALEVYRLSGTPLSEWHRQAVHDAPGNAFRCAQLVICPAERAELHRRIESRFQAMMEQGFLEEVRRLHRRGDLHRGLPAIRAAGYRQLWDYLEGECSLETAVSRGIVATRQLAKRQLTWLRRWPDLFWIHTRQGVAGTEAFPGGARGQGAQKPLKLALNYLASVIM